LEKYAPQRFVILSINIVPEEDEFVIPFLKGNHYGFIGLRDRDKKVKQSYKVVGAPTNFLVDPQGRVIFKPHVRDVETQRTLEMEVEALLSRVGAISK
jgi:hypothetical protein